MQTGIDVLKAMKREWTPDKYVSGVLARNSYGASVNPDDQNAVKFCASGIMHRVCGTNFAGLIGESVTTRIEEPYNAAYALMNAEIHEMYGNNTGMITLNDSTGGYEKIMEIIDRILIREEAKKKKPVVAVEERELVTV